jgi:hypothetical protein
LQDHLLGQPRLQRVIGVVGRRGNEEIEVVAFLGQPVDQFGKAQRLDLVARVEPDQRPGRAVAARLAEAFRRPCRVLGPLRQTAFESRLGPGAAARSFCDAR